MTIRWKFFISILALSFFSGIVWANEEAVKKAVEPHFAGNKIES